MNNPIMHRRPAHLSAFVAVALCLACSAETGEVSEQVPQDADLAPVAPSEASTVPEGLLSIDALDLDEANVAIEPVTDGSGASGDVTDKAGCTYIQYCNYPNHSIGTRCIWSACSSFCSAVAECIDDTNYVCGSPMSIWTILTSAGDITMSSARAACGL